MATTTYSFKNVVATLDRQSVYGFFEGDDVVMVTENADIGTGVVGADGSTIFSQAVNNAVTINVKLQHTSPTHKRLGQLLRRQKEAGALGTGFQFAVADRATGEGGATSEAYIQQAPDQALGTNATVREWVLFAGDYRKS